MLLEVKEGALKRLNYIKGHIEGIRRMVEEERYCVDILKQTYAVKKALDEVEALILEGHLKTHVVEGIRDNRAERVVQELLELYRLWVR